MISWGGFEGLAHRSKRWVRGFICQTLDSLEGLGGCSHSNVGPLKLFREETEGGVLLIFLLGGNFSDEMGTSRKSRSELDYYLKHQHKVNLPLPILSWVKFEIDLKQREKHLEKSCRIFCASFNCEGGVIFLRRLLRQKLLERKKSMPRLFLFRCLHLFITSIHNLLHFVFFMEFCVPSFRVRWPYQTFTRVRVRDGDKMGFFATRIVD